MMASYPHEPMPAPDFPRAAWLNTDQPLTMPQLRGQVVLVDLWDYTCINCLRALPYVREWQQRYADLGLTVVGVHTPVFTFGRERHQVELALQELDIRYPVLLDNTCQMWRAYENTVYPARYLVDQHGVVRYSSLGEGDFATCERLLQQLLRERDASVTLPPLLPPLHAEHDPTVPYQRPTPELRSGLAEGALGNPEGYAGYLPLLYQMPARRLEGAFYVAGAWQAGDEYFAYQGQAEGIIQLAYTATAVNAVLSPHVETVERMLNPDGVMIEIWQDDRPIDASRRGDDLTADGRIRLDRPRLYNLVRNPEFEHHELTLRVRSRGTALYAFSFIGGVQSDPGA